LLHERNAMSWDDFKESKEASDWEEVTTDWKEAVEGKEAVDLEDVPTDWKEAVGWETDDSKG
jgi:hypothetical protein